MKSISMILFAILLSTAINAQVRGIVITQISPTFEDKPGSPLVYDTLQVKMFYSKNKQAISLPYYLNGNVVPMDIVFEKGSNEGNVHLQKKITKVAVDSFLNKATWINRFNFYHVFKSGYTKLVSSTAIKGGLVEVYAVNAPEDQTGEITLYYNKMEGIDYSLCKEMELKGMKLYKVHIVDDERFVKRYNMTLSRSEQNWILEEIQVPNDIKKYF